MSGAQQNPNQATDKTLISKPDAASVLNCTKVVRLFVVGKSYGRSEEDIRAAESTTGADVFVVDSAAESRAVGAGNALVARSIGRDGAVVDHHEAHKQNPGGVVTLSAANGEQIEWQCDVEFMIEKIEVAEHAIDGFAVTANAPANPFVKSLDNAAGGPCMPIRSGPLTREDRNRKVEPWKQLYKAHFLLKIGKYWRRLDPDFYCGSPTP